MSLIGVVVGSAAAVLAHPRWLLLALAGFLVRGGILLLLIPIVEVPTTAAMANTFGPTLVGFVFGGVSPAFVVLVGSIVGAAAAWLILGGLAGAAIDLALIRGAAASADLEPVADPSRTGAGTALAARLLAHLPTVAVIAIGAAPLVDAAYQELIHPGDPTLSVPVRVILRVPAVVGALVAAWVLGEAVGGLAVRHLASGAGLSRAFLLAARDLIHPVGILVLVVADGAVLGAAALGWTALGFVFDEIRRGSRESPSAVELALGFALLSIAWLGAAGVLALATAWRSSAWTFAVARRVRPRTIESGRT